MQHMEFPATGMPDFVKFAPNLRDLNIRECANQEEVKISPTTFDGLEGSLKNLSIYSCNIPVSFWKLDFYRKFGLDHPTEHFEVGQSRTT